jgi:carbamoyl-phosphate synthase large subunit
VLAKWGVEMIGANEHAIEKAEDRLKFKDAMTSIGLGSARSGIAHSLDEAWAVQKRITAEIGGTGFPMVIRPSFTLGGTGGGIAYNPEEFEEICKRGIDLSPTNELLIEESLIGWKEYEMEVVRDRADNCIIVCAIENLDPMGIHTGDSITVAPAQTLTDKEYQLLRNASIAILREIGVDTGGSNVQFSINPKDGRMVVIEMNPRVSRSSALASKATGFPIAKIAAKLAVGYTLDELRNDITGGATPASFEPSIDYVVTKIPRFAFEKFPAADPHLTTQMKSVGEVMAMGRTFQESFQKALRGLETGIDGLTERSTDRDEIIEEIGEAGPERILYVADAFRIGLTLDEIFEETAIDPWFLAQIEDLVATEKLLRGPHPGQPDCGRAALGQAEGLLRQAPGQAAGQQPARCAPCAAMPGRAAGLQAGGHLRGRVRHPDRLPVQLLRDDRRRVRGRADHAQEDHGAGRWAQPHRPGHRVRLLLRACGAGDAR